MGWNLKEAALACGLPPSSWTNWETKGKRPHDYVQVCQAIAARTGANFEWLALGPKEDGITPTKGENAGVMLSEDDWFLSAPSYLAATG
jgi:hypothetical protein